jgi:hypothetical protein
MRLRNKLRYQRCVGSRRLCEGSVLELLIWLVDVLAREGSDASFLVMAVPEVCLSASELVPVRILFSDVLVADDSSKSYGSHSCKFHKCRSRINI